MRRDNGADATVALFFWGLLFALPVLGLLALGAQLLDLGPDLSRVAWILVPAAGITGILYGRLRQHRAINPPAPAEQPFRHHPG
ncbi:hypothetical protein ACWGB8_24635 [Kitasatospora sp. NPDC054939]